LAAVELELRRRGFSVAPAGVGASGDLWVSKPPAGRSFYVRVRGLSRRNHWIIPPTTQPDGVFYVLALVPVGEPARFFVLSEAEASRTAEDLRRRLGRPEDYPFQGFNWGDGLRFEDRWSVLPQ
jgi:hypothetical protein